MISGDIIMNSSDPKLLILTTETITFVYCKSNDYVTVNISVK